MNSDTRMPAVSRATRREMLAMPGGVQPALGGDLLASLRHQADSMRLKLQRDRRHLLGRRHFEVDRRGDRPLQPGDVVVADVAPVLAQVDGDAVAAGLQRQHGGPHSIGMRPAARVSDGCDVIDIDPERIFFMQHSLSLSALRGDLGRHP